MRGRQIDRRKAQAAVAIDFGEHAAGRHHDEGPDLVVDAIANQCLGDAGDHWGDEDAIWRTASALLHGLAHLADGSLQRIAITHVQCNTAGFGLVRNVRRENLQGHGI